VNISLQAPKRFDVASKRARASQSPGKSKAPKARSPRSIRKHQHTSEAKTQPTPPASDVSRCT